MTAQTTLDFTRPAATLPLLPRSPLTTVIGALLDPRTSSRKDATAMTPTIDADADIRCELSREFILAGSAIFTVKSGKSGEHYTFKVVKKENDDGRPPVWFVSLLTGPDNENDYSYLGVLNADTLTMRLTAKSRMREDSTPVKVLQWAMRVIKGESKLMPGYRIHHEGRCGRCGRMLTVSESVESGLGPECAKAVAAGR